MFHGSFELGVPQGGLEPPTVGLRSAPPLSTPLEPSVELNSRTNDLDGASSCSTCSLRVQRQLPQPPAQATAITPTDLPFTAPYRCELRYSCAAAQAAHPMTDRILTDPTIMLGKPVIRGTRITVELVLRKLSEGATEADLLDAYPPSPATTCVPPSGTRPTSSHTKRS